MCGDIEEPGIRMFEMSGNNFTPATTARNLPDDLSNLGLSRVTIINVLPEDKTFAAAKLLRKSTTCEFGYHRKASKHFCNWHMVFYKFLFLKDYYI